MQAGSSDERLRHRPHRRAARSPTTGVPTTSTAYRAALAQNLHETLATMRERHAVAYSEEHGGFWVVTGYEDVLRVAQDWRTFSSAHGVSVPETKMVVKAIPEHLDPPQHREYKRLISAFFTPAAVAEYEEPSAGAEFTRLIDQFVEAGRCDFMADLARPFPGLAFFELVFEHAARRRRRDQHDGDRRVRAHQPRPRQGVAGGIARVDLRFRRGPAPAATRGDVVDAVLAGEIEGAADHRGRHHRGDPAAHPGRPGDDRRSARPVHDPVLPGAGGPGAAARPSQRIPDAAEELLRLEPPFIAIARTAMADTEIGGHRSGRARRS